jgi:DNA-directed RNA polymerase specialized sigma24 family protein
LKHGNFPLLGDRDDLWALLVTITARKAADLIRHDRSLKRGGGNVVGEVALEGPGDWASPSGLDQLPGREPTPEFVARMNEACGHLLDALDDATLRQIAVWKLEGYRDAEIALRLGIARRSVERKLEMIRSLWSSEIPP